MVYCRARQHVIRRLGAVARACGYNNVIWLRALVRRCYVTCRDEVWFRCMRVGRVVIRIGAAQCI